MLAWPCIPRGTTAVRDEPVRSDSASRVLADLLKDGGGFFDAGANIGIYSVLASRLAAGTGRIVAIEMIPETAAILREHLAMNQCHNVTVIEMDLGLPPRQNVPQVEWSSTSFRVPTDKMRFPFRPPHGCGAGKLGARLSTAAGLWITRIEARLSFPRSARSSATPVETATRSSASG